MSTETQTGKTGGKRSHLIGFLELLIVVAVAIGVTFLVRHFVMEPYQIPSGSMEDTIEIGDRVFSEKISLYSDSIEQGDIVTFNDPEGQDFVLIKRVIALGGQTVDLRDGIVYVDGVALDEPYTDGKPTYEFTTHMEGVEVSFPYTVPEGCLWVMGDNRTNSQDSRYFGAVSESSLTGRAFLTYWPFSRFGLLD